MLEPNLLLAKASPEFTIKSEEVRRHFEKKLLSNIKLSFSNSNLEAKVLFSRGRIFIYTKNSGKAIEVLKKTFGINSIAPCQEMQGNSTEKISAALLKIAKGFLKKGDSFALRVNRIASHEFSSQELARALGKKVMDSIPGLKVNLSKPEKEIFVEVLEGKTIFFTSEEKCCGGLPIGVGGKIGFVFEANPREFESALLLMRRGCNIFPIAGKNRTKAEKVVSKLTEWNCGRKLELHERSEIKNLEIIGIASAETNIERILSKPKNGLELFPLCLAPKANLGGKP